MFTGYKNRVRKKHTINFTQVISFIFFFFKLTFTVFIGGLRQQKRHNIVSQTIKKRKLNLKPPKVSKSSM